MKSILSTIFTGLLTATVSSAAVVSPTSIATLVTSSDVSNLWPAGTVFPPAIDYVPHSSDLVKRSQWHIYGCQDPNWKGKCENMDAELNQCYDLRDGWENSLSSMGPDKGDIYCVLFSQSACVSGAHQILLTFPGLPDLRVAGMDDMGRSFRCGARPQHTGV